MDSKIFLDKLKAHAGKVAILTGAGVSTPSGIPDFRSPNGIYSKYDPEELFGLDNFLSHPSYFYKFAADNIFTMKDAKPNVVHHMVAKLDDDSKEAILKRLIILQNIGPSLGRPYVDTVKQSKYKNMKEMRIQTKEHVLRIFFAFDP
ncbi:Sir2 family NAD-dependent protein deacetylase, partial [Athalassotoga sp.]